MTPKETAEFNLGPRATYVPAPEDKPYLIEWAIANGTPDHIAHDLPFVELVNLYHAGASQNSPTDVQRACADAVARTIAAMGRGTIDEELIRYLARNEAEKLIATIPPQRIEISIPNAPTVNLDGVVHYMLADVIQHAAIGDDIMMVGPAGCGKTRIGEDTARALNLACYITGTVLEPHEIIGYKDGYGNYHETPFRRAFENGGIWIADEIDAWDASALLAANAALANGLCQFPDRPEPLRRHADFRMIATANTFGTGADRMYVGRTELDAASLDRFTVIEIDYDLTLERMFASGQDAWLEYVWRVRKRVAEKRIRHVVSSRAIMKGARALATGIELEKVESRYLFKGMSESDRSKVA